MYIYTEHYVYIHIKKTEHFSKKAEHFTEKTEHFSKKAEHFTILPM